VGANEVERRTGWFGGNEVTLTHFLRLAAGNRLGPNGSLGGVINGLAIRGRSKCGHFARVGGETFYDAAVTQ
jgi:hypothetical protein